MVGHLGHDRFPQHPFNPQIIQRSYWLRRYSHPWPKSRPAFSCSPDNMCYTRWILHVADNDAACDSVCVASIGRITNEWDRIWKESVVAYFLYFLGIFWRDWWKLRRIAGYLMTRLKLELGTWIKVEGVICVTCGTVIVRSVSERFFLFYPKIFAAWRITAVRIIT